MFGRPWTALAAILFGLELVFGKHNGQSLPYKYQQIDHHLNRIKAHQYSPAPHTYGPILSQTTPSSIQVEYKEIPPSQSLYVSKLVACPAEIRQCPPNAILNFSRIGLKRVGDIFVNSPDAKELYLDDNEITEVSSVAFGEMQKLETLSLSGNNISVDKLLWFSRHVALQKLVIDDNKRYQNDNVLSEVFQSLPRLQQLFLRRDNIFKFRVNLTKFAPQLSELDLSGNRIEDVDFLVSQLPKTLSNLRLDDNRISSVTTDPLKYVDQLFVSGNKIEELCGASCSGNYRLSLNGMDRLSRLNASRNKIDAVASDSFQDTRNLKDLDLSANDIRSLPDDVFNGLHFLEQLRISRNRLTSVPKVCSLSRVKHLDLSGNRIAEISDKSFCSPMQLETVNLANNHILNVDSNGFINLQLLRILDLSSNLIDKLPITLINNARQLHTLLLKHNSITNIDEFFDSSQPVLQELHLEGNPLPFFKVRYMPVTIHVNELKPTKRNDDAAVIATTTKSSNDIDDSNTDKDDTEWER